MFPKMRCPRAIRASLGRADITAALTRFGISTEAPLTDRIPALHAGDTSQTGSTDVGTVSWVVPTVQMRGATHAIGTPLHSWQLVAQGKSGLAHKGMLHVARVMAETARLLALDPGKRHAAHQEFRRKRGNRVFINPLPEDAEPAVLAQD